MKKILRSLQIIIMAAAFAVLFDTVHVNAAPKQMADGNVFDAEFYAAAYPDVKAVFGNNEALLYQHYISFGINEGRLPYAVDASALKPVAVGPNGVTEPVAYQMIMGLQGVFPEGMPWDFSLGYYLYKGFDNHYYYGAECAYYAFLLNDYVFGDTPNARKLDVFNPANFHVGDILRYNNNSYAGGHSVVVLAVDDKGITVTEANYNGKVHWGRRMSWTEIASKYDYVMTRYNI